MSSVIKYSIVLSIQAICFIAVTASSVNLGYNQTQLASRIDGEATITFPDDDSLNNSTVDTSQIVISSFIYMCQNLDYVLCYNYFTDNH